MKYQFSDCVLDSEAFSLMPNGEAVPLEPQVFDLLLTLVRKPGAVLTCDDLIEVGVLCRILRSARVFQRCGVLLEATGPDKASFGRCRGGGFSLWLTYLVKRSGVPRSLRDLRRYCHVDDGSFAVSRIPMKNHPNLPPLKGRRFPRSIVSHAVWAYFRVNMSLRDVEDLLAERGIAVSYETIRSWVTKFGQQYARSIRRDRPKPNDRWHLDEVVIAIKGRTHWLWRFADADYAT